MAEGPDGSSFRIIALEAERKRLLDAGERQRDEIRKKHQTKDLRDIDSTFTRHTETASESIARQNIGLRTLDQFQETRESLIMATEREKHAAERDTKKPRRKREEKKAALSFDFGEEEEEEEVPRKAKLGKNPSVDTHFLPDRDRQEWEREERAKLRREFLDEQERIKNELVEVTWSYWDGSGHRRATTMKKGFTVAQFLDLARREFKELHRASIDDLLFIKEDCVLPHDVTFYEMIVTKARGKSGPLFRFDVKDDVKLVTDINVERDETHAGKVVERHWYEKNKHIFPASNWQPYEEVKRSQESK